MVKKYIPDQGDLIWLDFNPQVGREQAGKRPALVISDKIYNKSSGLAVCCPITSKQKNYPFEVKLNDDLKTVGAVLSDHLRSIDWTARNAVFIERISQRNLLEVLEKLRALLF